MINNDINKQIKNHFLKPYVNNIEVLSVDYPNYFYTILNNNGIIINKEKQISTLIDWENISNSNFFFFDYEGSEIEISQLLRKSFIKTTSFLIIEFGYDIPVLKVDTNVFIDNWNDFVAASGYMGITIISNDSKFIMEFTDGGLLYSNFKIRW